MYKIKTLTTKCIPIDEVTGDIVRCVVVKKYYTFTILKTSVLKPTFILISYKNIIKLNNS